MILRYIFYLLIYILIISILSIYIIIKWIRFSSYLGKIYKLQELSKALRIVSPFSIFQSTSNLPAHHSTFPKFPQKRPPTNKRIHQQINEIKFTVATIDCYELTYQKTLQFPPNFLALSPRARKKKQKKKKEKTRSFEQLSQRWTRNQKRRLEFAVFEGWPSTQLRSRPPPSS